MDIRFEGKNILVSGATGHLGRQLVNDYCMSGANMLVLLDTPKHKDALNDMIMQMKGQTIVKSYTADYRKSDEIHRAVEEINKDNIMIDVLVNNAGINILKKITDMDEDTWDWVLDVN